MLIYFFTRVSAPLGIGFRVDAGCVDIVGVNGMPSFTSPVRDTFVMQFIAILFDVLVRIGPAVFVLFLVLITGLKGISLFGPPPIETYPTKSTTSGNLGTIAPVGCFFC